MRVAITGGTGFLGRHLARRLVDGGHAVRLISRGRTALPEWADGAADVSHHAASVTDRDALQEAFDGCDAVAHLAGINYERGQQTYDRVHRAGTDAALAAADEAGVDRVVLTSYLRARPGTGSGYLTSKWDAERSARSASLPTTVLKPAAIFGPGDQLLTHLARWLVTVPVAPRAGLRDAAIRPVAVGDVVRVATAALTGDDLEDETVALMGPETLTVAALVRRIASAVDRPAVTVPTPAVGLHLGGWLFERTVDPPVVTRAGVRMLTEGMTEPAPASVCTVPGAALAPEQPPAVPYITEALDDVRRYGLADLRH